MDLNLYLDSTYLKTPAQSGLTEEQTRQEVEKLTLEAVENRFKLVMVRPEYVKFCKELIADKPYQPLVGTVIGFHEGTASLESKLKEAQKAIEDGVDELDYVVNYQSFIDDDTLLVKEEIIQGTRLGLENHKVVKWIIEVATLTNEQIANITKLIRNAVVSNFGAKEAQNVFVKSSTGFYPTEEGKPNGATFEAIQIMKENAGPLPIKAAGGVRSYEDAVKMIGLGVTRIGTSSALSLMQKKSSEGSY